MECHIRIGKKNIKKEQSKDRIEKLNSKFHKH